MSQISRRTFVAQTSAAAAASLLAPRASAAARPLAPAGTPIRVGLIGCGGRGSGAAAQSLGCSEDVTLVAMGDVFARKVEEAHQNLLQSEVADKVVVPENARFSGLDAYREVIHHPEVDLVILATPPAFRPQHLAAAVAAGKHSFVEKPGCVDPKGYRSVLESGRLARQKKVAIVTGTQFRRSNNYAEIIAAIHDGAIGDVLFAQARYCSSGIWYRPRQAGVSDAEYQLDNWYHFVWLSGDQIVEQAVHNIDAMNWVMGGPPVRAYGDGGQLDRPADSEIYDSMAIDYEYGNGATVAFRCRQHAGANDVSNRVVGTKGEASIMPFATSTITGHDGKRVLEVKYQPNAYVFEHVDLIASIRAGEPIVEIEEMAASSLTAVMGRMAAYTGERVEWDFVAKESVLDLMPADLSLDSALASHGVAVPGQTRLI